MQRNTVEGMVGSGGSFHAYDPESVLPWDAMLPPPKNEEDVIRAPNSEEK